MAKKSTSKPKTPSTPAKGAKQSTPRRRTGGEQSGGTKPQAAGTKPQAATATAGTQAPQSPPPYVPPAKSVQQAVKALGVNKEEARQLLVMSNAAKYQHGMQDDVIQKAIRSTDANGKNNGKVALTRLLVDQWSQNKSTVEGFGANAKLLGLTPQQLMEGEAQSPGHVVSLLAQQKKAVMGTSADTSGGGAAGDDIDPDEGDDDIAMTNVPKPRGRRAPATETDIGELPEGEGQGEGAAVVRQPIIGPEQLGDFLKAAALDHVATINEFSASHNGSVTVKFGVKGDVASGRLGGPLGGKEGGSAGAETGSKTDPKTGTAEQTERAKPANANASRLDRGRYHAMLTGMGFTDDQIRGMPDKQFQETVTDAHSRYYDPNGPEYPQRIAKVEQLERQWKQEDWDKAPWTPQAPPGWATLKKTVGPPVSTASKFLSRNAINIGLGLGIEEGLLPAVTQGAYPGIIRYLSRQANSQQQQQQQQQQPQGMYPQQDFSPVEEDPLPGFGGPPADYFFQQQPNPAGRPPQR